MRIVSLVPSATETLFALGVGDAVVGVTHECDFPPEATNLPQVTRDVVGPGLAPDEVETAVRDLTAQGRSIYALDEAAVIELEPSLIVTQSVCSVCAVSVEDVQALAERMDPVPTVVSLDPGTLGEALGDVRTLAQAVGAKDAGVDLIGAAAVRIDRVRLAMRDVDPVPVAVLEWLDPVYTAGHWVPQMLEHAGGLDLLGLPGEPSTVVSWEEVAAKRPQVVIVSPCGYDAARSLEEAYRFTAELEALGAERVVALDGSAYLSRPGPRLVDALELLAHVLHPGRAGGIPVAATAQPVLP